MIRLSLWHIAMPLRLYARSRHDLPGKGFLTRKVLRSLLPPEPAAFEFVTPAGQRFLLRYREVIGLYVLLHGKFEDAETRMLINATRPGTVAIDVGAHVGLLTVPLAAELAGTGLVWAFEPLAENASRLERHLALNHVSNVQVRPFALGSSDGDATLSVADDSAYSSLDAVSEGRDTGSRRRVPCARLDSIWQQEGSPDVSVLKVDVEGAEIDVLCGAGDLIESCRPLVLVEANDETRLTSVRSWFSRHGYVTVANPDLLPWNHAFVPLSQAETPTLRSALP